MSDDRTILITGAAGALGGAVVAAFLDEGARLVLIGHDQAALERAFPALARDPRHALAAADLGDALDTRDRIGPVVTRAGRIDALVHVAGGFAMGEPVHALSEDMFTAMMRQNAWSFVSICRVVVPGMIAAGGGSVVAVSARAAFRGAAMMGAYCASKSALQRLVESLSAEVRDQHVNVNSVAPGTLDTPANRRAMPDADASRWVAPRRLAETIVFLASPRAADIHGQHLQVDALS